MPSYECDTARGAEHGPTRRQRHRFAHHPARELRDEPEEAEAHRRVLRLVEGHRSVAQAETSRTLQSGMDLHLRGGGLQPGAVTQSDFDSGYGLIRP